MPHTIRILPVRTPLPRPRQAVQRASGGAQTGRQSPFDFIVIVMLWRLCYALSAGFASLVEDLRRRGRGKVRRSRLVDVT